MFSISKLNRKNIIIRDRYLPRSSNISGNRKFKRDHSSAKLFCRGVPVRSRRWVFPYILSSLKKSNKITGAKLVAKQRVGLPLQLLGEKVN